MRKLFRFVLTKPLPPESHRFMCTVLAVPVGLACKSLTSVNTQGVLCPPGVCYLAIVSVIVSSFSAGFGYYVPDLIRAKTTLLTLALWTVLAIAFSVSACTYESVTGYGAGITVAVGVLLL